MDIGAGAKVLGGIAIGDNVFYGGDVQCAVHMDMVIHAPTVTRDSMLVVDNGQVNLDAK